MNVVVNNFSYGLNIRESWLVVVLNEVPNQLRALPVNCLDVQAKIAINEGWRSCNRRGTVNIDFILSVFHKLVQSCWTFKKALKQRVLISIVNWKIDDGVDSFGSVPWVDLFYISSSLLDFNWCLEIEHCSDSVRGNFVHIYLKERIWTDNDSWIGDFRYKKASQKVTISFVNTPIHNIWFIMEVLFIIPSASKLALVVFGILEHNVSLGLSFGYDLVVVSRFVAVVNLSLRIFMKLTRVSWIRIWDFECNLPRSHTCTVFRFHPIVRILRSLHLQEL